MTRFWVTCPVTLDPPAAPLPVAGPRPGQFFCFWGKLACVLHYDQVNSKGTFAAAAH